MAKRHLEELNKTAREQAEMLVELMMARYPDEMACERKLLEMAYPAGFICPRCGWRCCAPVKGRAHKWQCTRCSHQFCVTKGTVMESTHLPLRKWFAAILLEVRAKSSTSASTLQEMIGCSHKTAVRVHTKIRRAIARLGMRSTCSVLTPWK